ncbi:MAG: hypothetical protein U0793_09080 [Gemmataceae bacterium]
MRGTLFILAVATLAAAGCGGDRSQAEFGELVPVSGVVTRGGAPANGGVVEFVPDPNKDEFMINAEVGSDGRFSLTTVRTTDTKGERKNGLAPGKYRVVYRPPLSEQALGAPPETVELAAPVTVAKADSDLKITLPARKK